MQKLFVLLILIACFSLGNTCPAMAQRKVTASATIWPELQLSYAAGEKGLFFFQNQYRINTDSRFNDLSSSGLLSKFERIQVSLGYEQTFTDHWRGGVVLRYAAEDYPATGFYSLFLRHTGAIKSLFFNKQLMLDYVDQEDQEGTMRSTLAGELGKQFELRQHMLTPFIRYEASTFSDFTEEVNAARQRFIDRTRLKIGITYEVTSKLHLTPYFTRQTDYYFVEIPPVYDEDDVLITNGYRTKRNRITPVIGLSLTYNINKATTPANIIY